MLYLDDTPLERSPYQSYPAVLAHSTVALHGDAQPSNDRNQIVSDGLTSAPSGDGNALQLARVVQFTDTIDAKNAWGGQSFALSLAGVLERGLRRMFKELALVTGWRCLPQDQRSRLWDDAHGEEDPNRMMIADILLQRDGQR